MTLFEQLEHAIGVLAASPEKQRLYLTEIGLVDSSQPIDGLTSVDELALQFEDATYLVGNLVRNGALTAKASEAIDKLDNFLLRLSGMKNSEFWTLRALDEDSRWTEVRALAQECLSVMEPL